MTEKAKKENNEDSTQVPELSADMPREDKETSGDVTLPREEYEKLIEKIAELEGMREKLLRSAADYENAKKRLARDREEFVKFGQESLIRDLLPVLAHYELALAHAGDTDHTNETVLKNMITGVQMVHKQMLDVLKSQGLERIETKGKIFDPHEHEAVGFVEEEGKEDEIVEEVSPGYRLHHRVIQAPKVRVRHAPRKEEEEKA